MDFLRNWFALHQKSPEAMGGGSQGPYLWFPCCYPLAGAVVLRVLMKPLGPIVCLLLDADVCLVLAFHGVDTPNYQLSGL